MTAALRSIDRRGACPALATPMQTGDGLLVRLNPVAQGLSPKQLIGLCESAARNGNGIVEVTGRGSIQIRGLTRQATADLASDINTLDIETRTGIPVETGPLAGFDPDEVADPRLLAEAIRRGIADAGLAPRLGPKVSVVVDGGGQWSLDAVAADVRCVARQAVDREDVVWRISIAGDGCDAKPLAIVKETDAAQLVLTVLTSIAELGVEGRARALPSPLWGGSTSVGKEVSDARRGGGAEENPEPSPLPPRLTPLASIEVLADPPHKGEGKALLGPIRLHGAVALAIALPFGSMTADTLIAFAQEAKRAGAIELRPAPPRTLLVLGLNSARAEALREHAARLGFVTTSTDPRASISACPGAPACASGHIATRDIATAIASGLPDMIRPGASLHVSGCSKGCAHPAPAPLTLVGDENGIGLVVNGTARQKPIAYTRPEALNVSLERLAGMMRERGGWPQDANVRSTGPEQARLAAAFRLDV